MKFNLKKTNTESDRKFDYLNFLYSLGAVIILIGVIAKLLEWEVQDFFMTLGLSTEAVVFGISSIKFNKKPKLDLQAAEEQVKFSQIPVEPADFRIDDENKILMDQNQILIDQNSTLQKLVDNSIHFGNVTESENLQLLPKLNDSFAPDILWQLDEIGIISFPSDIFYQPEWLIFNDDDYNTISQLFLDLFGKKIIAKKQIPLLKSLKVRLPESGISNLNIQHPTRISKESLNILLQAFSSYKFKSFFDQFIVFVENEDVFIRSANQNEFQIFGGESAQTLIYCKKYYPSFFVISPDYQFLKPYIKYKNEILLDYLIKRVDTNNHESFDLMTKILFHKNDNSKSYFLEKLKPIAYNKNNSDDFIFLKSIVYLLISFNNKNKARTILNNLIYFKNKDGKTVNLSEMVQVNSKIIKIDESFNFKLVDLFNVEYLDYLSSIKDCIKNLIDEQFVDKSYINELFEVNKVDTIKEIYTKYLNFINKYEISPNAVQNNFDLACKNLLK
jgi:hypothetical protein